MRIAVDFARCEAHGECMMAAPAVFQLDDSDILHVEAAPDPASREAVEKAARNCPTQAIAIEG